jgi:hypothetical protein
MQAHFGSFRIKETSVSSYRKIHRMLPNKRASLNWGCLSDVGVTRKVGTALTKAWIRPKVKDQTDHGADEGWPGLFACISSSVDRDSRTSFIWAGGFTSCSHGEQLRQCVLPCLASPVSKFAKESRPANALPPSRNISVPLKKSPPSSRTICLVGQPRDCRMSFSQ